MKRVFSCWLLIGLLLTSVSSFSPAPASKLVEEVLSQTNQFRKTKGKPALLMREDLNAIAARHSDNMASGRAGFGHSGFNKRYKEAVTVIKGIKSFAENVAYGATSGKEVVTDWKNSPPHRRNMLGSYKYIGIGTAKDSKGRIYYTQVFVD